MSDVLEKHLPMLYRTAWMLTGNEADAQDLAHDAMVSALTSLGRFRGEAKISSWLAAIVINRYRTWRRARDVRRRLQPEVEARAAAPIEEPSREAERREETEAIRRALERLDEDHRMVVVLSIYQGLDSTEIGRILDRSPGTVRSQLFSAREKLREYLSEIRHERRP